MIMGRCIVKYSKNGTVVTKWSITDKIMGNFIALRTGINHGTDTSFYQFYQLNSSHQEIAKWLINEHMDLDNYDYSLECYRY